MKRLICTLACGVFLSFPVIAHHSFAAEYDGDKPASITGTITKIDWQNPHVYLTVETKDEAGKISIMTVEGHPPNILHRTGWTRDSVKAGDVVSITGWASKDGSRRMAGREVTWPDGKKLFVGPPSH